MQKEIREILRYVANKYNIPLGELIKLFEAPFKLQAHIMRKVCDKNKLFYPTLRIPHFGIFFVPPWKKYRSGK